MLGRNNRRLIPNIAIFFALVLLALGLVAAGPRQEGVPPAPYGATFFSGKATLLGDAIPGSVSLVGCIDGCDEVYQSEPVNLDANGDYNLLQINPIDTELVGRVVTYHLFNEFGRITAEETNRFEGDFEIYQVDLTFVDPLPTFVAAPPRVATVVELNPSTGLVTTATGSGFAPNSVVSLSSDGASLGTVETDDDGTFRLVITAPSFVDGVYEIRSADREGAEAAAVLTVPNLTGADGPAGQPGTFGAAGAIGVSGAEGPSGLVGAQGPDGTNDSMILEIIALALAGIVIPAILVVYLYLNTRFKELARRLPPPGIR